MLIALGPGTLVARRKKTQNIGHGITRKHTELSVTLRSLKHMDKTDKTTDLNDVVIEFVIRFLLRPCTSVCFRG